jgi:phospholipid/cholesterol/gamma-HCH transport system ATP-binding protein
MTVASTGLAIELVGLTKRYGGRAVVDGLNATIPASKTTVLLGPSGSGKSTLLRMITGLMKPDEGQVVIEGAAVAGLSPSSLRLLRQRFGMLFQDNALFTGMSVFDNIAFPLRHVQRADAATVQARVSSLLSSVGLAEMGQRQPDQLSGGQRKRVALARALALDPEVVLFDEPTSGLDPQTSATIDALIVATQRERARTCLVITHDIDSARAIADTIGLLQGGKLIAFGDAAQVLNSKDPEVRAFVDRQPSPTP